MTARAAIVVGSDGLLQQLQSGDTLLGAGGSTSSRLASKSEIEFHHNTSPYDSFLGTSILVGTCPVLAPSGVTSGVWKDHPGIVQPTSSVMANSGYTWATSLTDMVFGGGEVFDIHFQSPASFTSTTFRAGFLDTNSSADAVDGAYFEFSGSGVIIGKTSSNSTRSSTATLATLSASTWYHARVTVTSTSSITFDVFDDSGTNLGTAALTTNIPITGNRNFGAGFVATNSGTTPTALANVDYMSFNRTLTRGATT